MPILLSTGYDRYTYEWMSPFYNTDQSKCTLHVPMGTVAAYQSANVWQNFNIEEQSPTIVKEDILKDVSIIKSVSGVSLVNLPKGLDFSVYSISGVSVYSGKSRSIIEQIVLPQRGIYIITINTIPLKFVY